MKVSHRRFYLACCCCLLLLNLAAAEDSDNWPGFRGSFGRGLAHCPLPTSWNAEDPNNQGIRWRTPVPGLGHSSPAVFGDKIFLATAIAADGQAPLKLDGGGEPNAADDNGEQSWVVLCYSKSDGQELWRRTARRGIPKATRHAKATHANTTLAIDDKHAVAFFGSEGLYCFDHDGNLLWERDLGIIDVSKYGIGWGYASSPAIYQDCIALVCDDPDNPFVVVLRLSDGQELWRASRQGDSERSWGSPLIHAGSHPAQVVVNGWPWIVSYDLQTGQERWRIRGGGDNPVPTPFVVDDRIYITSAHGAESPIYVVHEQAHGNLTAAEVNTDIIWQTKRGGSYMSTPVVVGDYLYLGNTNGVLRCFHALTGEKVYEQRLDDGASISASLVAADEKVYCASENGFVYVVRAGPEFELLAKNPMGEACLASPAISDGVLYIRTLTSLLAIE